MAAGVSPTRSKSLSVLRWFHETGPDSSLVAHCVLLLALATFIVARGIRKICELRRRRRFFHVEQHYQFPRYLPRTRALVHTWLSHHRPCSRMIGRRRYGQPREFSTKFSQQKPYCMLPSRAAQRFISLLGVMFPGGMQSGLRAIFLWAVVKQQHMGYLR